MLLRINNPDKVPLFDLWRIIVKFTFDKKNCPYNTNKIIEEELLKWNRDYQIDMVRYHNEFGFYPEEGSVLYETWRNIKQMSEWIMEEEAGQFQEKVDLYKTHSIDYRLAKPQCVFFPECKQLRNYARGKAALEQAMKDNPQDYLPIKGE